MGSNGNGARILVACAVVALPVPPIYVVIPALSTQPRPVLKVLACVWRVCVVVLLVLQPPTDCKHP